MEKKKFILSINNSDVDGIDMFLFEGTYQEASKRICALAAEWVDSVDGRFESVEISPDDVTVQYAGYHVEFTLKAIDELTDRQIKDKYLKAAEKMMGLDYFSKYEFPLSQDNKEANCRKVVDAVDRALKIYSFDNIDVSRNEETNLLYVGYHSRHNSFPVEKNLADADEVDLETLEEELDKRGVGHWW